MIVRINATQIRDWDSFHAVFKEAMGFPAFYSANKDAWIDCMTYLDDPAVEMTAQHVSPGTILTLQIDEIDEFASVCTEQYQALIVGQTFWKDAVTVSELNRLEGCEAPARLGHAHD